MGHRRILQCECVCVCMCASMFVCVKESVMYVRVCVFVSVCAYACVYMHVCVCVCAHFPRTCEHQIRNEFTGTVTIEQNDACLCVFVEVKVLRKCAYVCVYLSK